jgi:RsiW-degrading membrane proteinase PrsW (M82 family)
VAGWRFLLFVVVVGLLAGCSGHIVGTHDKRLDYDVPSETSAVSLVRSRLLAAQILADVEAIGNARVRVTVDEDLADTVDDLLRWPGGLSLYRVESEDGVEGSASEVRARLRQPQPSGQRAFAEMLGWDRMRTRLVSAPPLGTVALQRLETCCSGRGLRVVFRAPEPLLKLARAHPDALVAVVRGGTLLATVPAEALTRPVVTVPFGRDIASFTRVARAKRLLQSPCLPSLTLVAVETAPARWGLACLGVLLPLAVSLGWLVFVRRFDRARPEPRSLVLVTFVLGGIGVVFAAWIERSLQELSPYTSPSTMTLGGQLLGLPSALVSYTLVVGLVEEGAKFLAVWGFARRRKEFDEPVDGIVYASAAALGFAAVENMLYFSGTRLAGSVVAARALTSVPAHVFFSSLWGYALGKSLVSPRTNVLGFFALAVVSHGAFNTLLSIDGLALGASLLMLVLGWCFLVLLRRALRHGAVPPGESAEAPESGARAFVRIGSATRFAMASVAMLVCGFALVTLGTAYELLQRRVGLVFIGASSVLVALFGLAARAVALALPLDLAVDTNGVTFAGVACRWEAIRDYEPALGKGILAPRAWVVLHTDGGALTIGPMAAETCFRVVETLDTHRRR